MRLNLDSKLWATQFLGAWKLAISLSRKMVCYFGNLYAISIFFVISIIWWWFLNMIWGQPTIYFNGFAVLRFSLCSGTMANFLEQKILWDIHCHICLSIQFYTREELWNRTTIIKIYEFWLFPYHFRLLIHSTIAFIFRKRLCCLPCLSDMKASFQLCAEIGSILIIWMNCVWSLWGNYLFVRCSFKFQSFKASKYYKYWQKQN